jgi:hypothetical protein
MPPEHRTATWLSTMPVQIDPDWNSCDHDTPAF